MNRLAPPLLLLVLVTSLLLGYGRFTWSWVAGPLAALLVWAVDRKAHDPGAPPPAHTARRREPTPVD